MLKLRIKVSYVQQYHYHLIRDERDASIEQPSASKVKWTSPGPFMMSRVRILWHHAATLTWRGWGRPSLYNLIRNQSYCVLWKYLQSLPSHLTKNLLLGVQGGSIIYLESFFPIRSCSNCPPSQLAESQHLKLGHMDVGKRRDSLEISIFCRTVKRFFLP